MHNVELVSASLESSLHQSDCSPVCAMMKLNECVYPGEELVCAI